MECRLERKRLAAFGMRLLPTSDKPIAIVALPPHIAVSLWLTVARQEKLLRLRRQLLLRGEWSIKNTAPEAHFFFSPTILR
jgi:hypothetical protein